MRNVRALVAIAQLAWGLAPAPLPQAQPAGKVSLVIDGPTQAQPGDLVVLDASGSLGVKGMAWAVSPKSAAGRMLAVEENRKVVFATSQPGVYGFFLAGASPTGEAQIVAHEVTVGQTPPGPTPPGPTPPGPTPPPPGPTPDRYGLAAFTAAEAGKISDPDRAANAARFAAACDAVVAQIGAGVLRTEEQISDAFRQQLANVGVLTQLRWRPLLSALADKFDSLRLTEPSQWAQAFTEIAAGLRQVR